MRMLIALLLWSLAFAVQAIEADRLVLDARQQVGVTLSYDPTYRRLSYPGGDVPMTTGVCTDVVIRALRQPGLDLQDSNIDHRCVPNLMTWFKRQGWSLPVKQDAAAYQPGDIVTWDLGRGLTHIGIISDRQAPTTTPLVLHNIGRGTQEEDILFAYRITGHYRPLAQRASAAQ